MTPESGSDPMRPRVTWNRALHMYQVRSQWGIALLYLWDDAQAYARWAALPMSGAPNFYGELWNTLVRGRV